MSSIRLTRYARRDDEADPGLIDATQALYLRRLVNISGKVRHHGAYLVASDRRMVLLNRALLSTYRQCRALGLEAVARDELVQPRGESYAARPAAPTEMASHRA